MRILSPTDGEFPAPPRWDAFVRASPDGHLLQSWAWGQLKALYGWRPLRFAAVEDDTVLAAVQVLVRRLPPGWWTTAYIPKGPVLGRTAIDSDVVAALLSSVHVACRRQRCIALKLELDWEDAPKAAGRLVAWGFRPSQETIQPRRTVIVDLLGEEGAILAQMKPKTRYNIRLALRRGVTVRLGTAFDLPTFYALLQTTSTRDGFGIHTRGYYEQAYRLFAAQEAVGLLLAEREGRVLATLMAFTWGTKAWYMYGASSDEGRQHMPTHLLQWEAMRWAKARGCQTYDLWGIPDLDEDEIGPDVAAAEERGALSSGLGGLYRFKRGFGGHEVRYVGAFDWVYSEIPYRLLTAVWRHRRRRGEM